MLSAVTPTSAALVLAASLGTLVGLVIAAIAWRRTDTPGATPFALFVLSQSMWNLGAMLLWLSPTFAVAQVFKPLTHVFATTSFLAWVFFAVEYTGQRERFVGWKRTLLLVWAVGYVAVRGTNPLHERMFTSLEPTSYAGLTLVGSEPTSLFLLNAVVIYGTICWSYVLIGRFFRSARAGQRRQAGVILLAHLLFVVVTAVYYLGGYSLHPALDPSPVFFSLTVVLVAVALFWYDFLDVTPMATDVLLDEMRDPVLILDNERIVVERNESASALVDATGTSLAAVCPALADALEKGAETVELPTSRSEDRIYDVSVSPVHDQHDALRGQLVVLRDVTLSRRRQRELERTNEELERANERLESFARVVSHDLRNPLNVAYGFTKQARTSGDVEVLDESLAAMDDMSELIDDLLDLARKGQTVDDPTTVDLEAVAEDAWPFVEGAASLEVEATGHLRADPDRLGELLANCYRNAREHGGDDVTVTVGEHDDGFYVEDDGPGIPEAERDRVFESGYSSTADGTGFGLAIVERIASAHQWTVTAENDPDGGARIVVSGVELDGE